MPGFEGSNRRIQPATRVDPITGAVIQGALENIAIEMGYKLMRMSYSSIIRESEDFGAALTDAEGRQLCECKMSTPLQSGPIPGYIHGILDRMKLRGDVIRPGDVIMHNDPYGGASHGPDVAFVVPVFHNDKLIGFSVTTAHHLDIGAHTPGSCGVVDAVDTYAEGLQFKALKVVDQGKRNEVVWHMVRDNIRISDLVVGDMNAQISAAHIGAERFLELVNRYGIDTVNGACEDLMDYSERLMREAIRAIPDGAYTATTHIDGFLDDPDPSRRDLPLVATVIVRGDEMTVDLTGTAPQVSDRPINMPFHGTTDCAIWMTIRSILLDTVTYGQIPQNSGLTRPIKIVAPKGCLANPIFPAPRDCSVHAGQRLGRHRHEGSIASRARAGQCRHRQSARHRLQWSGQRSALGAYGNPGRQLRRTSRHRRYGCGRHLVRQYAQQSDRRHGIPPATAREPL